MSRKTFVNVDTDDVGFALVAVDEIVRIEGAEKGAGKRATATLRDGSTVTVRLPMSATTFETSGRHWRTVQSESSAPSEQPAHTGADKPLSSKAIGNAWDRMFGATREL